MKKFYGHIFVVEKLMQGNLSTFLSKKNYSRKSLSSRDMFHEIRTFYWSRLGQNCNIFEFYETQTSKRRSKLIQSIFLPVFIIQSFVAKIYPFPMYKRKFSIHPPSFTIHNHWWILWKQRIPDDGDEGIFTDFILRRLHRWESSLNWNKSPYHVSVWKSITIIKA